MELSANNGRQVVELELSDRKLKILQAIIDDYIDTGIPVGSRTLSKKGGINYSSATIRNEMADLEELGLLEKLHTSAGRMPSDAAYRLYVDRLMPVGNVTAQEAAFIHKYFNTRMSEITEVLDNAAKALSDTTNHIAMVTTPDLANVTLKRIQLVKLTDTKAMLIFVTDSGILQDAVIDVPPQLESEHMERLSNMLTDMVREVPLEEVAGTIQQNAANVMRENQLVMDEVFTALQMSKEKKQMFLEGAQKIFNYPEYRDIAKAQRFLQALETKDILYSILGNSTDFEFSIKIGSENEGEDFREMSIVTATYKVGEKNIGSYGVIGPTRMDYSKVLSVLKYVGLSLNGILSSLVETKDEKKPD